MIKRRQYEQAYLKKGDHDHLVHDVAVVVGGVDGVAALRHAGKP